MLRRFSSSSANLAKRFSVRLLDLEVVRNDFTDPTVSGAAYHQTQTFFKGTDRLVASNGHTVFRPLKENDVSGDVVFQNLFWLNSDAMGKKIQKIATQQCYDVGFGVRNSMACTSEKQFHQMTGFTDYILKYYVSYYDIDDLRIPKDLNTTGITVKNARDVPDEDILNYDAKVFKYNRSKLILDELRGSFGRVAYNDAGEVVGFGAVLTKETTGECSISAMYADEKRAARTMLKSILEEMTLDGDKYWRLEVRSNDHFADSYGWIRPFVKTMTHRSERCSLMCDHKPTGVDVSRVFVNFHPTLCPV